MRNYDNPFDRAARRERKARFEYRARMAVEVVLIAFAAYCAAAVLITIPKALANISHQIEATK